MTDYFIGEDFMGDQFLRLPNQSEHASILANEQKRYTNEHKAALFLYFMFAFILGFGIYRIATGTKDMMETVLFVGASPLLAILIAWVDHAYRRQYVKIQNRNYSITTATISAKNTTNTSTKYKYYIGISTDDNASGDLEINKSDYEDMHIGDHGIIVMIEGEKNSAFISAMRFVSDYDVSKTSEEASTDFVATTIDNKGRIEEAFAKRYLAAMQVIVTTIFIMFISDIMILLASRNARIGIVGIILAFVAIWYAVYHTLRKVIAQMGGIILYWGLFIMVSIIGFPSLLFLKSSSVIIKVAVLIGVLIIEYLLLHRIYKDDFTTCKAVKNGQYKTLECSVINKDSAVKSGQNYRVRLYHLTLRGSDDKTYVVPSNKRQYKGTNIGDHGLLVKFDSDSIAKNYDMHFISV